MQSLLLTALLATAPDEALLVLPVSIEAFPPSGELVPMNVRPLLQLHNVTAGNVDYFWNRQGNLIELEPTNIAPDLQAIAPGPLAPDEVAIVQASCCNEPLRWTAGAIRDDVPPLFGDGVVDDVEIVSLPGTGYSVELTLPGVLEPAKLLLIGDDTTRLSAGAAVVADRLPVRFAIDGIGERRECFRAVAVDAAGNETEFPEELCFDLEHIPLERAPSCAQASSAPLALGWAALALRGRRWRRWLSAASPLR